MAEGKPIGTDADGCEIVTNAVLELLNRYPGLNGRNILFEELGASGGIAMSADNGAMIMSERRSITDHIVQQCQYPFFVICRSSDPQEYLKLQVQSFMDTLGKWLCREPVIINGEPVQLAAYPELSGNRRITRISRSNAYGIEPNEDGVQDWLLPCTVQYTNEYDLW